MAEKRELRKLRVERKIYGAPAPRPLTVVRRRRGAYPGVSKEHLDLAEILASPLLLGPPLCDELVALIAHTFTEEEASVAKHLSGAIAKPVEVVAKAVRRPVGEVEPLLEAMAHEKYTIASVGPAGDRKYRLVPVMPGIFEQVLMNQHPDTLSDWHRRFAELFEALYETGYSANGGVGKPTSFIRFVPVKEAVAAHPMALPSDKMEVVLDRYSSFAVGNCQCRTVMRVTGRGCDKPIRNCMTMGEFAEEMIEKGMMWRVSKKEALEIKAEAEANGLVSWLMNVESDKGQGSCSCCGCCCHAMRTINEFNSPATFAPPHFLPRFDRSRCTYCGKCAKTCPMGSLVVDAKQKSAWQLVERCIGCGLCSLACDKERAIAMEPVPDYRLPPDSWFGLLARDAPAIVQNVARQLLDRSRISTWWRG